MNEEEQDMFSLLENMKSLDLVQRVTRRNTAFFSLKGTDYILILDSKNNIHWRVHEGKKGLNHRSVNFEEVWDSSPVDIQEELTFHLDIFRNT